MQILISDCGRIDDSLPIALKYNTGIDIQEFTNPDILDNNSFIAADIGEKIKSIPSKGFHGPFSDLVPASRDKKIRQVTLNRFQTAYNIALSVGANHLNLHAGFIPKTYTEEVWLENSVGFWEEFLSNKNDEIEIHIENVYEDSFHLLANLIDTLNNKLGRDAISSCVDIGHINANSSKPIKEWIEGLNSRIKYVHLHNNDGIYDDHFGLWQGKINVQNVLEMFLKYSPRAAWMLESRFPYIEQSVLWMKEKGYLK